MPSRGLALARVAGALLLLGRPVLGASQGIPLAPVREFGQTVTPVFEGWYRNPDGSYSLSFGYFNRNSQEVVDVPIGPGNFIGPGAANQGQPTQFQPRRHWGVFAVTVPADFGDQKLVWTLIVRGQTFAIPGGLKPNWEIDALHGEAGSANTPPVLRLDPTGPQGRGPGGVALAGRHVKTGEALTLTVWATDDGKAWRNIASDGRAGAPVTLTWFKHQGPGDITFSEATPKVDGSTGQATTTATFSMPGEYLLRVRANDDSGVTDAGHAQCCWTNGFVKVTVTP